jgi:hypothetical protein
VAQVGVDIVEARLGQFEALKIGAYREIARGRVLTRFVRAKSFGESRARNADRIGMRPNIIEGLRCLLAVTRSDLHRRERGEVCVVAECLAHRTAGLGRAPGSFAFADALGGDAEIRDVERERPSIVLRQLLEPGH